MSYIDPLAAVTAKPKTLGGGHVPRREPDAEYARPARTEGAMARQRGGQALDASAAYDRLCASRPLKPPRYLEQDRPTRSAGALELAREIRRREYLP